MFLYQRADSNGDGILSVEEYHKILQEHNIRWGLPMFDIKVSISIQNFAILQKKEWVQFSFLILLNSAEKTFKMSTWLIHPILNLQINLLSL